MSALKYILPAVAIANLASAQSSCSASATATIQNAGDATAIAACQTYTGSIALATGLGGSVSFDGSLTEINGNLVGNNATQVESISAANLKRITGDFRLEGMTQLSTVSFGSLTNIDGELNWQSIPNLGGLTFGNGVQRIQTVTILDTQIQDLSGINLKSAQSVTIGQNSRLNKLSWQLSSVDGNLILDGNGGGAGFDATFGNLMTVGSMTVNSVSSLAINSLRNATGLLAVQTSTLQSLSAPNLTSTGGLTISSNQNLNNISMPLLKTINGSLLLNNDPMLTGNISFPALTNIRSAINATGAFNELLLPQINTIAGAVYIKSTGHLTQTCAAIKSDKANNVFMTNPTCSGAAASQSGSSGSGGSSTSDGSSSSTSSSAAAPGLISSYPVTLFGSTGLLAVMLGLI